MASEGTETGSGGWLRRMARRLRVPGVARVTLAVLALGIAATIGAFFVSRYLKSESQHEALLRRAAITADTLRSEEQATGAILDLASAVAEATGGDPSRFTRVVGERLDDESVANVSLVRLDGGEATPVATVGSAAPTLVRSLTGAQVEQLRQVALGAELGALSIGAVAGEQTALIAAPGTRDGRFAVTAEFRVSALEAHVPAVASEDVDWAVYAATPLGSIPVAANADTLPLRGPSVESAIRLFGADATLVVVAKDSLVSGVRDYLPWLVLVLGLLLSAVSALLVELAYRRAQAAREQQALVEQNERLRQLDRQKDEFISLVSHDLRTPLTSIIGYTELLLEEEAAGETRNQRHFLEIVERNGRRLLAMVEDLLFMARLQAGRLHLDLDEVDLASIAAQSVEALRPKAQGAGIELRLETDAPVVHGDERRLGQLVDNLLSNALKFTPAGGSVTVRATREGRTAVLEVEDTGIGIPPGEVGQLFERFYRASSATERETPGTGLGLTIAKAIVDAHGGTIGVRSAEGAGTTFRIELPAGPPPGQVAPAPPPPISSTAG